MDIKESHDATCSFRKLKCDFCEEEVMEIERNVSYALTSMCWAIPLVCTVNWILFTWLVYPCLTVILWFCMSLLWSCIWVNSIERRRLAPLTIISGPGTSEYALDIY